MNPLPLLWNCRPRFTELVSGSSVAPAGVPFCQMLHGHWGPDVVKFQLNGLLIGVPLLFCAPDTVAVYVVLNDSEFVGVNVATVLAPLNVTEPGTLVPPESFTVND